MLDVLPRFSRAAAEILRRANLLDAACGRVAGPRGIRHHVGPGRAVARPAERGALIREAREEVGVVIDEREVEFTHVMHNSSSDGRVAFFSVRRWTGVPENLEPDKCSGLRWFSLGDLPDHLILAAASLWKVARFPSANHGAEVDEIEESVAADGLTVAASSPRSVSPACSLPTASATTRPAGRQAGAHLAQTAPGADHRSSWS